MNEWSILLSLHKCNKIKFHTHFLRQNTSIYPQLLLVERNNGTHQKKFKPHQYIILLPVNTPVFLLKLGASWPWSTVCNTLTTDKYFMQLHFKQSKLMFTSILSIQRSPNPGETSLQECRAVYEQNGPHATITPSNSFVLHCHFIQRHSLVFPYLGFSLWCECIHEWTCCSTFLHSGQNTNLNYNAWVV